MATNKSSHGSPWNKTGMTFREIAERLGVSRQCVTHIHKRMLNRLAEKLAKDPEIRDWLIEQNYALPQPKDSRNEKDNLHSRTDEGNTPL